MVDFTVMVWYTPQFKASFSSTGDMNVFIDLIFAEANQGFINSNIPVMILSSYCIIHIMYLITD